MEKIDTLQHTSQIFSILVGYVINYIGMLSIDNGKNTKENMTHAICSVVERLVRPMVKKFTHSLCYIWMPNRRIWHFDFLAHNAQEIEEWNTRRKHWKRKICSGDASRREVYSSTPVQFLPAAKGTKEL